MTKRSQAKPKCAPYFAGLTNSHEFTGAMNVIAADLVSGRISLKAAKAYLAEARTILKMVELQLKFGKARTAGGGHA
jgi:hypothetical protein